MTRKEMERVLLKLSKTFDALAYIAFASWVIWILAGVLGPLEIIIPEIALVTLIIIAMLYASIIIHDLSVSLPRRKEIAQLKAAYYERLQQTKLLESEGSLQGGNCPIINY